MLARRPSGIGLATGSDDTTVRLWDIDPASLAARACALPAHHLTPAEWHAALPGQPYQPPCP